MYLFESLWSYFKYPGVGLIVLGIIVIICLAAHQIYSRVKLSSSRFSRNLNEDPQEKFLNEKRITQEFIGSMLGEITFPQKTGLLTGFKIEMNSKQLAESTFRLYMGEFPIFVYIDVKIIFYPFEDKYLVRFPSKREEEYFPILRDSLFKDVQAELDNWKPPNIDPEYIPDHAKLVQNESVWS